MYNLWLKVSPSLAESGGPSSVGARLYANRRRRKIAVAIVGLDAPVAEKTRLALYDYNWTFGDLTVVDAGNLRKTTPEFLTPLLRELHASGVIPVLIGADRTLFRAQYEAFAEINRQVSILSVDQRVRSEITPAPSRSTAGPASTVNTGNNAFRYVVSSTINKGTAEVKIFNNLYRQTAQNETSTFFTSQTNALYGVTDRFNAGVEARFRRASYTGGESDASRTGLTSFGPFIRVAPFGKLPNFSVQSTFRFALGEDLTGAETGQRFLDWEGNSWFTQVFNDFPIGDNFSVFGEVDFLLEDIGAQEDGRLNRFSTPVTGILSYFPTPKTTVYGLASYSPFWQTDFDYFYQFGGGLKYQITPKLELEMLVTAFDNEFLNSVAGTAATYNFGVRFNL